MGCTFGVLLQVNKLLIVENKLVIEYKSYA